MHRFFFFFNFKGVTSFFFFFFKRPSQEELYSTQTKIADVVSPNTTLKKEHRHHQQHDLPSVNKQWWLKQLAMNTIYPSQFKWPELTACPPGCIQLQGKFTHKPETCSNYNRTEPIPIISNSFRVKRHFFTISLSDTQERIRDNQKPNMAWSTVRLKRWREVAGRESYSRWTASQSYVLKKKSN